MNNHKAVKIDVNAKKENNQGADNGDAVRKKSVIRKNVMSHKKTKSVPHHIRFNLQNVKKKAPLNEHKGISSILDDFKTESVEKSKSEDFLSSSSLNYSVTQDPLTLEDGLEEIGGKELIIDGDIDLPDSDSFESEEHSFGDDFSPLPAGSNVPLSVTRLKGNVEGIPNSEVPANLNDFVLDYKDIHFHSVIGRGSFGEVYKGSFKGREIAIKHVLGWQKGTGGPTVVPEKAREEEKEEEEEKKENENKEESRKSVDDVGVSGSNELRKMAALHISQLKKKEKEELKGEIHSPSTVDGGNNRFSGSVSNEHLKYIEREVATLSTISHNNIVDFIGVCAYDEDHLYIVMEYIEGGDLRSKLRDPDLEIPWISRLHISLGIALGVQYIHQRDIIHRDLKSANVRLDKEGNAKLIDFGLARRITSEYYGTTAKASRRLRTMSLCGTETYMAPEVVLGTSYDRKADIYSLGILLLEIITRMNLRKQPEMLRHPRTYFDLDWPKFRTLKPPDCPGGFFELVEECIKYEPTARPNIEVVVGSLGNILFEVESKM